MKNIETPDKRHLSGIIDDLKEGAYVVPDFQREFLWEPWEIVDLIKSIFMDYYIGTLLLWKAGNENIKKLKCEQIYGYNEKGKPQHIVLDGQQRLTALYYALFGPNKLYPRRKKRCLFFVKIKELLDENYEDAFYYEWETKEIKEFISDTEQQYQKKIIPLCIIGKQRYAFIDWIRGYEEYLQSNCTEEKTAIEEKEQVESIFRDVLENYYISYIELDRDISVSKVCDIFAKINSTGVPLSIFDLLNAVLTPQEIFLKEMWRKVSDPLNYTDNPEKMKIYILQVMSILKQAYCSPRYLYYLVPGEKKTVKKADGTKEDIILIQNKEEFLTNWEQSIQAIIDAIQALKNPRDYGAIHAKFIPYPSIIPPLAAIKKYVKENKLDGKGNINRKIRLWYWSSIFIKNYSSSVESQSAKDFNDLKKWFEDESAMPEVITQFTNDYKYIDYKREVKQGSAIYNAIFNLLILKEARDWDTFDLPEYSSLDDHHIVPNSWGKNKVNDDINSILNKTPLSAETNRNVINKELPNKYIRVMMEKNGREETYAVLESHLISRKAVDILLREKFEKEDYYEFLEERKNTIIKAIEELILNKTEENKDVDYSEIINGGEDESVEFKSTFYFNKNENKADKSMKMAVIKTIAGFLNTAGGRLLVGVEDNGNIFGLEKDYEINFRKDKDGFLQDFRTTLNQFFDDGTIQRHIFYKIEEIRGKEILVVNVEKSRGEIFLKKEQTKILYVRRGNKTDNITDAEDIHRYITDNWKR